MENVASAEAIDHSNSNSFFPFKTSFGTAVPKDSVLSCFKRLPPQKQYIKWVQYLLQGQSGFGHLKSVLVFKAVGRYSTLDQINGVLDMFQRFV